MASGRATTTGVPSIFLRAAAFLLDWAIVLLLSAFVTMSLTDTWAGVVFLGGLAVYHIGFVAIAGATPGKMAMRIQITDPSGGRLPPDRAILRYLVLFLSVLAAGLPLALSALLAIGDTKQRTIHDRVAGSIVVKLSDTGRNERR